MLIVWLLLVDPSSLDIDVVPWSEQFLLQVGPGVDRALGMRHKIVV